MTQTNPNTTLRSILSGVARYPDVSQLFPAQADTILSMDRSGKRVRPFFD